MADRINGLFVGDLIPTYTLAGCIEIFENVWPNPIDTIEMLERECSNPNSGLYWTKAETIGLGAKQNIRTNRLLPLTYLAEVENNSVAQHINNQFYKLLVASSNSYVKRFGINETLYHEHYNVLKYNSNQEYKPHYDGGTGVGRSISAVCYLNDDYEGGEIGFENFKVKIKPPAGSLILFPSNYAYMHTSYPILKGTKYALVTWIHDRPL